MASEPGYVTLPSYAKSGLVIENSPQRYRSWGLKEVGRRELADFVLQRWALPEGDDAGDDE